MDLILPEWAKKKWSGLGASIDKKIYTISLCRHGNTWTCTSKYTCTCTYMYCIYTPPSRLFNIHVHVAHTCTCTHVHCINLSNVYDHIPTSFPDSWSLAGNQFRNTSSPSYMYVGTVHVQLLQTIYYQLTSDPKHSFVSLSSIILPPLPISNWWGMTPPPIPLFPSTPTPSAPSSVCSTWSWCCFAVLETGLSLRLTLVPAYRPGLLVRGNGTYTQVQLLLYKLIYYTIFNSYNVLTDK